jgi:hypothetical protein
MTDNLFENLPQNILFNEIIIANKIHIYDILHLSLVNKYFNNLINEKFLPYFAKKIYLVELTSSNKNEEFKNKCFLPYYKLYNVDYITNKKIKIEMKNKLTKDFVDKIKKIDDWTLNQELKKIGKTNYPYYIQKLIIEKSSSCIQYINNQYKDIQFKVLNKDINNIKYVDNPTKEMFLYCVNKNYVYSRVINIIDNYHKEYILQKFGNQFYKQLEFKFVKNNPEGIEYIKNPNKKLQLLSIQNNINNIQYIKKPHPDIMQLIQNVYEFY